MSSVGNVVVTQLVVDASGAQKGVADFEASMDRAKTAANDAGVAGNSFDSSLRKWTQSLAQADPVIRAQINQQQALNRQMAINKDAVDLGIASQAAAAAQLEKVNAKYGAYVAAAEEAAAASTGMGQAVNVAKEAIGAFGIVLSAAAIVEWGKQVFEATAELDNQAKVAGVSVEALQSIRAATASYGLSAQDTDTVLQHLTRSMGDATAVVGPARTAFHDLGLSASDLAGGTEAVLPRVAAALLAIQDPAERARDEVALFARSGQQIEPALEQLSQGVDVLKQKAEESGQVISEDLAKKADDASNQINEAMQRLKVSAAPAVTFFADAFARLLGLIEQAADPKLSSNAMMLRFGLDPNAVPASGGFNVANQNTPAAASAPGGPVDWSQLQSAFAGSSDGVGFGQQQFQQYLGNLQEEVRLTGLSKTERAAETAAIAASVEKQKDEGVAADQINRTYAAATTTLDAQTLSHVRNLGIIQEQNNSYQKLKETFDKYLSSLEEEARLAGVPAAERENELAVIKAADIVQKQRGVDEKNLVTTYDAAAQVLGAQKVNVIDIEESTKRTNALMLQQDQQLQVLNAGLAVGKDQRDLTEKDLQDELTAGVAVGDQYADQRAQIEAKNAAIQKTVDLINLGDYMDNLREEASLAGLTADDRERQAAVLQAIHATHGQLTADQAKEIDGLVQIRQEMDKWQELVTNIEGDFSSFFDDILSKGELNFGKLFRSIEASFAQMIAQLAAQAIAQPIIIPMVEDVVGSLGLGGSGAAGLAGGSSAGGLLGNAGSLLNLGGGSDILGIGSLINGVGTSLGFGTSIAAANLGSITTAGIGGSTLTSSLGTLSGTTTGGIFGTSLGGLLGGVGVGSLAGSLLFGNKNDAGLGSMGGAAAGALLGSVIPGIGTLIGGLLGGVLGGGLGSLTGSDNHGAWVDLLNGGASYALTQQGSSQNTQQVEQVAQSINQAVQSLQSAGVSVTNNIKSLEIGSSKDVLELANGQKINSKANDPDGLLNSALNQLLSTASATDSDIQKVIQTYQGQGGITSSNLDQFLSDIGFAQSLNSLDFSDSTKQLSQVQQALQQITQQFDDAIQKAQALGLDTSKIEDAKQAAVDSVIQGFEDTTESALKQITDPVGAAYDSLIAGQQQNLQDAKDLGADVSLVQQLNDAQLTQFLEGLTEDQRQALAATENLTGTVAYQLAEGFTGLSTSVEDLVNQANDAASAANAAASAWGNASDALTQASKAILVSDQSLSPVDAYKNAEDQFNQLKAAALGGDADSANQLASFASQFLQTSFAYNASSTAYANDLAMVQQTLSQVAQFSTSQQTLAQQQADSAAAAVTALQTIDTSIKNQTNVTQAALNSLSAQVAALAKQVQQSNTQARMAG